MLQPLAVRHEPQAWRNPFELQETLAQLQLALERTAPLRFPAKAGEGWEFLDLRKVTHFEVAQEVVHAWGGRGEVRIPGGVDLKVSRGSVPRLKERLGLT